MSESLPSQNSPDWFNVVSWNTLLDKTRSGYKKHDPRYIKPQSERLRSQVETMEALRFEIDIAMIQEAEKTKEMHCGEEMARALGYSAGYWFEHNTSKRKGEHIGMFGARVEDAEAFDLGHDKLGVITMIGNTAFVTVHFRKEHIGPMRADQSGALLERVEGIKHVVLGGDTNDLSIQKSRRMLHKADFVSAHHLLGRKNPKTHPTPEYRNIFYPPIHRPFLPHGTASDIIYVRGMDVHDAGRFHGDSDHYGVWATVSPKVD